MLSWLNVSVAGFSETVNLFGCIRFLSLKYMLPIHSFVNYNYLNTSYVFKTKHTDLN